MERLTEKHYAEKGYYMKCTETCCKLSNCDTCDSMADIVDRLGEYEDAQEAGLLVRLPCKVGSYVWRIWITDGRKPEITEHYMSDLLHIVQWIGKFGKTVFLTREEAEAALAKEG